MSFKKYINEKKDESTRLIDMLTRTNYEKGFASVKFEKTADGFKVKWKGVEGEFKIKG